METCCRRCTKWRRSPIDAAEQVQLMLSGDTADGRGRATARWSCRPGAATCARARPTQARYLENIATHDITFGIGPAGTGKTYLAVACAVDALERSAVQRIVLTRPAVEAGEKLGFLPGDLTPEGRPLPAAAVRRALRPDGRGEGAEGLRAQRRSRSRRWPSCAGARSTTLS
jgi:hypothetical protein